METSDPDAKTGNPPRAAAPPGHTHERGESDQYNQYVAGLRSLLFRVWYVFWINDEVLKGITFDFRIPAYTLQQINKYMIIFIVEALVLINRWHFSISSILDILKGNLG